MTKWSLSLKGETIWYRWIHIPGLLHSCFSQYYFQNQLLHMWSHPKGILIRSPRAIRNRLDGQEQTISWQINSCTDSF